MYFSLTLYIDYRALCPVLVMEILGDILRTVQGQKEDSDNQFLVYDDDNLQCEKQIIQCQITNDRLLGSTSKSLRKKYGNDTVNKAIQRLAKRRIRGKCSRKAEINKLSKTFKPLIEYFFKKKDESFSNGAL